jgi:hypothetical protein
LCLLTTWLKNDVNLAQITSPFPSCVVMALQNKWFAHGLLHSFTISFPLTFPIFVNTLVISKAQEYTKQNTGCNWVTYFQSIFLDKFDGLFWNISLIFT